MKEAPPRLAWCALGGARADEHKRIHEDAITVNGKTMGDKFCRLLAEAGQRCDLVRDHKPLVADAGFLVLRGNLFDFLRS